VNGIVKAIGRFLASEDAATAIEYAMMLILIIVVVIGAVESVGSVTSNMFQDSADKLPK
jgi:Flp pilus assembly pilin Flp